MNDTSGDQVSVNLATIKVKKMSLGMQVAYNQTQPSISQFSHSRPSHSPEIGLKQSHETMNALKMAMDTASKVEQRA